MQTSIMNVVLTTTLLGLLASGVLAVELPPLVDYQSIVSRADLVYDQPAATPFEGHPIGNGTMGTMVWTTPSAIEFRSPESVFFTSSVVGRLFIVRLLLYLVLLARRGGLAMVRAEHRSRQELH